MINYVQLHKALEQKTIYTRQMVNRYNLDSRQVDCLLKKGPLSLSTVKTFGQILGCTEEEALKKVSEIELESDN
jgi:hypothetical protein